MFTCSTLLFIDFP